MKNFADKYEYPALCGHKTGGGMTTYQVIAYALAQLVASHSGEIPEHERLRAVELAERILDDRRMMEWASGDPMSETERPHIQGLPERTERLNSGIIRAIPP